MACRGELAPVEEFTDPRGGGVGCGVRLFGWSVVES